MRGLRPRRCARERARGTCAGQRIAHAFGVALVAAVAFAARAQSATLPAGFQETAVITGRTEPTAVRFAANGDVFVAEKSGLVWLYEGLSDTTPIRVIDLRAQVHNYWDRGLLGLAIDPGYPNTPQLYVLYAWDVDENGDGPEWGTGGTNPSTSDPCPDPPGGTADGCVVYGRLSRVVINVSTMRGTEVPLLDGGWCLQYPSHSLGDLVFGEDDYLYVSSGEGASFTFSDWGQEGIPVNPCDDPPDGIGGPNDGAGAEGGAFRSQDILTPFDPASFDGAVLRLDVSGPLPVAPFDNPLVGNGVPDDDFIIAMGLRNPFRINKRPGTGEIWITDVGRGNWEELNRIVDPAGTVENFGWPCYEGSNSGNAILSPFSGFDICQTIYNQTNPGGTVKVAPYYAYQHSAKVVPNEACPSGGSSITGVTFNTGDNYPIQYANALFFGDATRKCVWTMFANANGNPDKTTRAPLVTNSTGRVVDIQMGLDGNLYYVDFDGGRIFRVAYFSSNQPPTALISVQPSSGPAPLTVQFNGGGSSDPENGALTYAWDLDDDGQFDDSSIINPTFQYDEPGQHIARLRVVDPQGAFDTASKTINVNNTPPTATITAPTALLHWTVGQVINFAGGATDPEDGTLSPSHLSWTFIMHHCDVPLDCHTHPITTINDVASGTFTAQDHEYPSFIEVKLTATDDGPSPLSDTTSVFIDPQAVDVTLDSSPRGLDIDIGSHDGLTPFTAQVIVGSNTTVSAPSPQQLGQTNYTYSSWSDGKARTHNFIAPASALTLTATFSGGTGCQLATPPGCNDGNACNGVETCDLSTGNCVAGTPLVCNDGSACTTDGCAPASGCTFTPLVCNDGNACTTDTCAPASGCSFTNNTNPCSDGNACTTGDVCNGGACAAGTPLACNDGNPCNGVETCDSTTGCVAGTALVCNDGNTCTTDSCVPASGCTYTNNTSTCSDGNACTTGDVCSGGTCAAGTPFVCNDGNPCNGVETCSSTTGCVPGTALVCNDGNTCTTDSCVPANGCTYANNTSTCTDGNACTTGDVCSGGACAGTPVVCNDGVSCTIDSCSGGTCVATDNCPAGTTCNTQNGVCQTNPDIVCVAAAKAPPATLLGTMTSSTQFAGGADLDPVLNSLMPTLLFANSTTDSNNGGSGDESRYTITIPQTAAWYAWGRFYYPGSPGSNNANSFFLSIDGGTRKNFGNDKDFFRKFHWDGDGSAVSGSIVALPMGTIAAGPHTLVVEKREVKPAGMQPRLDAVCLTKTTTPPSDQTVAALLLAAGCTTAANCDDADGCTIDACNAGQCTHSPKDCSDGSACTQDTCNPSDGVCGHAQVNCNDSNACTTDSCDAQTGCAFTALTCNDSNACTTDSCSAQTGCVFAAVSCNDSNACTTDSCDAQTGCVNAPVVCDDASACTTDSCSAQTGCVYTPVNCNDGNACTQDACNPADGVCGHSAVSCNDSNACTTDSCDAQTGCVNTAVNCSDGDACTQDTCNPADGVCGHSALTCNDSNACTTDSCNAQTGCVFAAVSCNDSNACTTDACNAQTGCTYTAVSCNDSNACTTDSCNAQTGCAYTAVTCNDSSACTTDSCNAQTGCVFAAVSCNDSNACTTDTCNAQTGCGHAAVTCNDSNACTTDSCNTQTGCVFAAVSCNDANACTTDSCNTQTGCAHATVSCNDANACTTDTCSAQTGCANTPVTCPAGQTCSPSTGTCQGGTTPTLLCRRAGTPNQFAGTMTANTQFTGGADADATLNSLSTTMLFANSTTTAKSGGSGDEARYTIDFPSSGQWYVWGRFYYPGAPGSNDPNSFLVKLDAGTRLNFGNNLGQFQKFHWDANGTTETGGIDALSLGAAITAGSHTVTVEKREVAASLQPRLDILCISKSSTPPTDAQATAALLP